MIISIGVQGSTIKIAMTFTLTEKMGKREEKERIKILPIGNRRGFSLLELLIVLFLIGLILALSFPDFRGLYEKHLFEQKVEGLKGFVLKTMYLSEKEGKIMTLTISGKKVTSGERVFELPDGYALQGKDVTLYPDGRTSGGIWIISKDGYKKEIHIKMFTEEVEIRDLP